jgi:hypothetical protein
MNALETPSINNKIEFSTTTLVVAICDDKDRYNTHIRYKLSNHSPNRDTALTVGSMIKSRKWHRVICKYKRRAEDQAESKQKQCNISTNNNNNNNNNNNQYNILQDDTLEEYSRYHEPWSLDSAALGNYCGKKIKIKNRKTKKMVYK